MEKYRTLKQLALEYAGSKDPIIFMKIIRHTERFLLRTIYRARRVKPYLKKAEMQDLYQTAIIGLHKALLKVDRNEPGSKLLYKISRYVGNEISNYNRATYKLTFLLRKEDISFQVHLDRSCKDKSTWLYASDVSINQLAEKLVETTPVYKNLELEDIRECFSKMLEEEVINLEELKMISMRFVEGMYYKDIAKQFGLSRITVSKRITKALNRLRYEFRRRGWE